MKRPYTGTEGPGKSRSSADDAREIPGGASKTHFVKPTAKPTGRDKGGKFVASQRP
ncbi:MAG: hypothetical protein ACYDCH_13715 [Gaiellaceae bacterium]